MFFAITYISAFSQKGNPSVSLNGNIKTMGTTLYQYVSNEKQFHSQTVIIFDSTGHIREQKTPDMHTLYVYNPQGMIIEKTEIITHSDTIFTQYFYQLNGNIAYTSTSTNGNLRRKTIYTFDGELFKQYKTRYTLPTRIPLSQTVFYSDQDGYITKICEYLFQSPLGDLSDSLSFIEEKLGDLQSNISYVYDENSSKIQHVRYAYDESGVASRAVGFYNKHEKLIKETTYTADDFPYHESIYKYDKQGNITERIQVLTDEDASIKITEIYKYKYDAMGNWIEMQYFYDGKPITYTIREIEYL